MRVRNTSLALVAPATEIVFDNLTMGYRFDGDYGNIQIVAKGLDGGTFSVALLGPPGDDTWRTVATGKTISDHVHLSDVYVCQQVKISFAALGGAAAPVVTLSMTGRLLRAS